LVMRFKPKYPISWVKFEYSLELKSKLPAWLRQFLWNFFWGTLISMLWYYGCFRWTKSFWISTILVNIITYFIGRYLVFSEGRK